MKHEIKSIIKCEFTTVSFLCRLHIFSLFRLLKSSMQCIIIHSKTSTSVQIKQWQGKHHQAPVKVKSSHLFAKSFYKQIIILVTHMAGYQRSRSSFNWSPIVKLDRTYTLNMCRKIDVCEQCNEHFYKLAILQHYIYYNIDIR
jgi:hypothetical protein